MKYMKFEGERTRPVRDLLAALPAIDARRVIDLGCGPGNSTAVLTARFPGAAVSGLDSSADMLAAARRRLPGVRFDLEDIEQWAYAKRGDDEASTGDSVSYDVILANAVLQWLPNHPTLLPALIAKLAGGGVLAVQMPDNLDEPAHRLMRDIASDGPWAAKLRVAKARPPMLDAGRYDELVRAAGCKIDIWRTTYFHALAGGASAVVEWFQGSGLRPFLAPLDDQEQPAFLARYEAAVARAYPATADGIVLLPFPRLFIVALH